MHLQHKICTQQAAKQATKQHGVVLFFALIALVVMSLAAVALIRSVDTASLIAGNLSFRRSATVSADSGTETALAWLTTQASTALENNITGNAYYATDRNALGVLVNPKDLLNALLPPYPKQATGVGIAAGVDQSGNTITYVIQRMCKAAGPVTETNCLLSAASTLAGHSMGGDQSLELSASSPIYRVTAKVVGPRNTVSYIQAFIS